TKNPCIPIPYTPVQRGRFYCSPLRTFVGTKELSQMGRPSQLNDPQKYPSKLMLAQNWYRAEKRAFIRKFLSPNEKAIHLGSNCHTGQRFGALHSSISLFLVPNAIGKDILIDCQIKRRPEHSQTGCDSRRLFCLLFIRK
ncbi:MAG: hypothetical protein KH615_10420, partial [Clostridiales bacterium]|nr:hypothetical protein [Clostridiales bacterium]